LITKDDVRYVAQLARLGLTEDEVDLFTGQLGVILEYAARVQELDIAEVPPTAHALPITNVFRSDEVKQCLPRDEALAAAPEREDNLFAVPKIV